MPIVEGITRSDRRDEKPNLLNRMLRIRPGMALGSRHLSQLVLSLVKFSGIGPVVDSIRVRVRSGEPK